MEATGMVGVGRMGTALLERLLLAGAKVTVYDLEAAALKRARACGAAVGASAADVGAAATIIHVIVHSEDDVLRCTTGPRGILQGALPGTLLLLHSTVTPETTRAVAKAANPERRLRDGRLHARHASDRPRRGRTLPDWWPR